MSESATPDRTPSSDDNIAVINPLLAKHSELEGADDGLDSRAESSLDEIAGLVARFDDLDRRRIESPEAAERLAHIRDADRNRIIFQAVRYLKRQVDYFEAELSIAERIQRTLLPAGNPRIPGFDIAGSNIPCRHVGGDYYDFFPRPDDQLGIVIGDVAGKGIPAAFVTACLQAYLKGTIAFSHSVEEIVTNLNAYLYDNIPPETFVTFFMSLLNARTGHLQYINAGHNPPLLRRAGGTLLPLKAGGPVLGIARESLYDTGTVELRPGDTLVMFTDGVTEAENAAREMFEEARVVDLIERNAEFPATEIMKTLFLAAKQFAHPLPLADDVTLVIIKRHVS